MLDFFIANMANIIIGFIVFAVITLVVIKLIRDKIQHKSSCGCNCVGCPAAGMCHNKEETI